MKKLIYLAVPYSHPSPATRQWRFEQVNIAAAVLMRNGKFVFSPISHTHPIARAGQLPTGFKYWREYDREMLSACGKLIVLCLPGWDESVGVQAEIKMALEMGIPVEYMTPS